MAFYAEDSGGSFERCPPGMHLARCYRIVDLGTQKTEYMGQIKYLHKIMLGWELHCTDDKGGALRTKDGRPFAIFKNYTLSWSEKANLRLDLQSWRGKPFTQEELRRFDLETILGAWCMLNIIERPGKTGNNIYSNVDGVTPVPAVIRHNGLPAAINKNEMFNLSHPDMELFDTFTENLKKKIQASPEYEKAVSGKKTEVVTKKTAYLGDDDLADVPF